MKRTTTPFGSLGGERIDRYDFTTEGRITFSLINYGATLIDVSMPDKEGNTAPVITGFDTLEGYRNHAAYFGATIGRFGNRIAGASFTVEGKKYELEGNNGPNNLHGGPMGFDRVIWKAEPFEESGKGGIRFSYTSPDGENGFPGTLKTVVTYTFSDSGEMRIDYRAETDKTTPVNLTNHTYWNLSGLGSGETVQDHEFRINASSYNPVDDALIPTGIDPVEGTPMDFRAFKTIGKDSPEFGYDHNWILDGEGMREACVLAHRKSGRKLTILTDQPGIQVYTSGHMPPMAERTGECYQFMAAALETQNFPNCVNEPDFPDCLLRPGDVYETATVFRLSLD
ncbi:MAG: galactose mutarotase [Spirochaetales bacterium]|nr:galactose mutarotase [Spirochaetales bacterium]